MEALEGAEELEADAGGDDQEAHSKQNQAAKLLSRTKDLRNIRTLSETLERNGMDLVQ